MQYDLHFNTYFCNCVWNRLYKGKNGYWEMLGDYTVNRTKVIVAWFMVASVEKEKSEQVCDIFWM